MIEKKTQILAVGDCNTLGVAGCKNRSYPERLAERLNLRVANHGCTMATTREGVLLLRDGLTENVTHLFIQFGLVDSYKTFTYSPYVLYYPDNIFRKQLRSLVKKYKKICRTWGLNQRFGEKNVVGIDEYEYNMMTMVAMAKQARVYLVETIPHKDLQRNSEIKRYNAVLNGIAGRFPRCKKINLFDHFLLHLDQYYQDDTHSNELGYEYIVNELVQHVQRDT